MFVLAEQTFALTILDYAILTVYLLAMIAVGVWFSRGQRNEEDYLLGGRNIHWFLVAASAVATGFSGISLVGAPGYVFAHDSKMFVVVIASVLTLPVVLFVLPFLLWLRITTVYEYLGRRFSPLLRLLASALFQLSKLAYVAVVIYTPSLLLSAVTPLTLLQAVIIIGFVATMLAMLGGMRAVVWTDTVQFFIMMIGIGVILYVLIGDSGGVETQWQSASEGGKTDIADFSFSLSELTVWGLVTGAILINVSASFSDQVMMQRYMSTNSAWSVTKSYLTTTAIALPTVALLYLVGILLFGYYAQEQNPLPDEIRSNGDKVLPHFIATQLPTGLSGMILAAIIAATISTVTSVLNSLCAATMSDFVSRWRSAGNDSGDVRLSRVVTIAWGAIGVLLACFVGQLGTILEQTLTLAGLIGGGLGGIFFLGLFTRRANATGAILGGIVGTAATAAVMFTTDIHFTWYYSIGMITCVVVGYGVSLVTHSPPNTPLGVMDYWRQRSSSEKRSGSKSSDSIILHTEA